MTSQARGFFELGFAAFEQAYLSLNFKILSLKTDELRYLALRHDDFVSISFFSISFFRSVLFPSAHQALLTAMDYE